VPSAPTAIKCGRKTIAARLLETEKNHETVERIGTEIVTADIEVARRENLEMLEAEVPGENVEGKRRRIHESGIEAGIGERIEREKAANAIMRQAEVSTCLRRNDIGNWLFGVDLMISKMMLDNLERKWMTRGPALEEVEVSTQVPLVEAIRFCHTD